MTEITASAPGSMMLMGEHAVLAGQPALVMATSQRLTIKLQPRNDKRIIVQSAMGTYQAKLGHYHDQHQLRFVVLCLRHFDHKLTQGLDISIDSEIATNWGFGSSAALVGALVGALYQHTERPKHLATAEFAAIFNHSWQIIKQAQGQGSGADVSASIYGGINYYRLLTDNQAQTIDVKLPVWPNFIAQYSGYKTPTPEVIAYVSAKAKRQPQYYQQLYQQIGDTCQQGYQALTSGDLTGFGQALAANQQLMVDLGVCDQTLADIIAQLEQRDDIIAAKISGSGLGDCVLGLLDPKAHSMALTDNCILPGTSSKGLILC